MNRYAHATFCDDIRQEQGGKLTLVGVYSSALLVSSFPAVLPKLCLVLNVITPASQPFKKLKLRIFRDTETLAEGDVPAEGLSSAAATSFNGVTIDDADRLHSVMAQFVFSPLKLDGPGRIRVRIETEAGELKANGLIIAQMPEALASELGAHTMAAKPAGDRAAKGDRGN